jgi:hypothetical protein
MPDENNNRRCIVLPQAKVHASFLDLRFDTVHGYANAIVSEDLMNYRNPPPQPEMVFRPGAAALPPPPPPGGCSANGGKPVGLV